MTWEKFLPWEVSEHTPRLAPNFNLLKQMVWNKVLPPRKWKANLCIMQQCGQNPLDHLWGDLCLTLGALLSCQVWGSPSPEPLETSFTSLTFGLDCQGKEKGWKGAWFPLSPVLIFIFYLSWNVNWREQCTVLVTHKSNLSGVTC